MSGHTPGPYRGDGHLVIRDDIGERVAVADTPEVAAYLARCANAHDDLLEALRRAHRFLFRCEGNGGSTEGQNTTLREECAAILAAIAKAEGGES